jgi:hypothetical protein
MAIMMRNNYGNRMSTQLSRTLTTPSQVPSATTEWRQWPKLLSSTSKMKRQGASWGVYCRARNSAFNILPLNYVL